MYVHKNTKYLAKYSIIELNIKGITMWGYSYAVLHFAGDRIAKSDSSGLSSVAVAVITFAVTFIVSVTATAIITFIVAYVCVKRTFEKANNTHNPNEPMPQEKVLYEQVLYEQVCIPSKTVTKNDLELQPNPAYGTSHTVTGDTNPAYEICK